MIIYVDIDETICSTPLDPNTKKPIYSNAIALTERIKKLNSLFELGHEIIYWTARGTKSGINHEDLTKAQLTEWGVRYHSLRFKKPYYDIFIDDKNFNATVLDNDLTALLSK